MNEEKFLKLRIQLSSRIGSRRFAHTLGVEEEIVRLGEKYLPDDLQRLRLFIPQFHAVEALAKRRLATGDVSDQNQLFHVLVISVGVNLSRFCNTSSTFLTPASTLATSPPITSEPLNRSTNTISTSAAFVAASAPMTLF